MTERTVRWTLALLLTFIAVTAVAGALWVVPTLPLDWLRSGPFTDFTIPAVALGLVGLLSALAALGVAATPTFGAIAAIAAGVAMALFEIVEVWVVGFAALGSPDTPQGWLQPLYFVLGLVVAVLGVALYMRRAPRPLSAGSAA